MVQDPDAIQTLAEANQTGSEELFKKLLGKDVSTLTGRFVFSKKNANSKKGFEER